MKKTKKKAVKAAKKSSKKLGLKKVAAKTAAAKSGVVPMGDRVLVKPTPQDTVTSFGIIIPDTAKEKPEHGVVVAIGPGRRGNDGELIPVGVSVGEKVMFSKYGYEEIRVEGVDYYLVREDSILAILN